MKRVILFSVSILSLFVISCSHHEIKDEQLKIYSDTTAFKADTVLKNVEIDNVQFTIMTFRDKLGEHREKFQYITESPLTVIIINNVSKKIVYVKKFDFDYLYINYSFHKAGNQSLSSFGKLYFEVNTNAGGSGSLNRIYYIHYKDGTLDLNKMFESSGELSYTIYNKDDNEIVLFEAIWGEGESHFEKHRYTISKYICNNDYFSKKVIGQTKFKYAIYDNEQNIQQTLSELKLNEPSLMESIYLDNYYFTQEKQ